MMVKYHLYDENYTHKGSLIYTTDEKLFVRESTIIMIEHIWKIHLIISNL